MRVQRAGGQVDPGSGGPGRGGRDDLRVEERAGGPAPTRLGDQQQAGGGHGQVRREEGNEFPIICISFRIEKLESTLENYDREKGADILPQKEEMIKCLQSELIKVS